MPLRRIQFPFFNSPGFFCWKTFQIIPKFFWSSAQKKKNGISLIFAIVWWSLGLSDNKERARILVKVKDWEGLPNDLCKKAQCKGFSGCPATVDNHWKAMVPVRSGGKRKSAVGYMSMMAAGEWKSWKLVVIHIGMEIPSLITGKCISGWKCGWRINELPWTILRCRGISSRGHFPDLENFFSHQPWDDWKTYFLKVLCIEFCGLDLNGIFQDILEKNVFEAGQIQIPETVQGWAPREWRAIVECHRSDSFLRPLLEIQKEENWSCGSHSLQRCHFTQKRPATFVEWLVCLVMMLSFWKPTPFARYATTDEFPLQFGHWRMSGKLVAAAEKASCASWLIEGVKRKWEDKRVWICVFEVRFCETLTEEHNVWIQREIP